MFLGGSGTIWYDLPLVAGLDLYYTRTDPAQNLITSCQDLDDLDRDQSDL